MTAQADRTQKPRSTTAEVLRPKHFADYAGVSWTTLWRREQTDPRFPKKIRFGARCVGYLKADIDRYLAELAEG